MSIPDPGGAEDILARDRIKLAKRADRRQIPGPVLNGVHSIHTESATTSGHEFTTYLL